MGEELKYCLEPMDDHAIMAEQSVIGAILIDDRAFKTVSEMLHAEDFHISYLRDIFTIAEELFSQGKRVDSVVILQKLSQISDVPRNTMLELLKVTPTAANVREYAKIVRENAKRRGVRALCREILDSNSDGGELMNELTRGVDRLVSDSVRSGTEKFSQTVDAMLADTLDFMDGKRKALSTGFPSIDNGLGGGLLPGMLVVIAGRPGMGKTTFALAVAENLTKQGKVLYITLEMTGKQLSAKIYARHTGVPARNILTGNMDEEQTYKLLEKQNEVKNIDLILNDCMGVTVEEIALMARSVDGLAAVVIDHLGLIRPKDSKHQSRVEQVTEISGALKRMAITLKVPILALSQLSRANSMRKDKRPELSDLRDSGSVEQDADAVILLHRDDYYIGTKDRKPWEPSLLEAMIKKTRFASNTTVMFNAFLGTDVVEEIR